MNVQELRLECLKIVSSNSSAGVPAEKLVAEASLLEKYILAAHHSQPCSTGDKAMVGDSHRQVIGYSLL